MRGGDTLHQETQRSNVAISGLSRWYSALKRFLHDIHSLLLQKGNLFIYQISFSKKDKPAFSENVEVVTIIISLTAALQGTIKSKTLTKTTDMLVFKEMLWMDFK